MKKLMAMFLTLLLMSGLAGCGSEGNGSLPDGYGDLYSRGADRTGKGSGIGIHCGRNRGNPAGNNRGNGSGNHQGDNYREAFFHKETLFFFLFQQEQFYRCDYCTHGSNDRSYHRGRYGGNDGA